MPSFPDPPKLHRQKALRRVEVDTHPNGRDKGIADSPSTGAAPQAPTTLDQSSPPTIIGGNSSSIHSPTIRQTHSCRCIFAKDVPAPLQTSRKNASRARKKPAGPPPPRTTRHRRPTPVQISHTRRPTSTGSPSAPEASTNGARTNRGGPYSTKAPPPPPPSPRPRRRDTNPRPTSTIPDRRESSGLHRLAKPRGPSEARKTAIPAG